MICHVFYNYLLYFCLVFKRTSSYVLYRDFKSRRGNELENSTGQAVAPIFIHFHDDNSTLIFLILFIFIFCLFCLVTARLVSALVISRLDYCNSVLTHLPASTLAPLQRVLNAAVRLVHDLGPREHVTPAMYELHWLPIA